MNIKAIIRHTVYLTWSKSCSILLNLTRNLWSNRAVSIFSKRHPATTDQTDMEDTKQ